MWGQWGTIKDSDCLYLRSAPTWFTRVDSLYECWTSDKRSAPQLPRSYSRRIRWPCPGGSTCIYPYHSRTTCLSQDYRRANLRLLRRRATKSLCRIRTPRFQEERPQYRPSRTIVRNFRPCKNISDRFKKKNLKLKNCSHPSPQFHKKPEDFRVKALECAAANVVKTLLEY